MRQIVSRRLTPFNFMMCLAAVALLFAAGFLVQKVNAASNIPSDGERLLTVYDRGVERVFLTEASTVGDALERADIELSSADTVEPRLDEKLVANNYNINIYRARPVIVVDGATRQKIMTPYQTPAQIAGSAGVTLYDEDVATLQLPTDIISEGASLELMIDRATLFTFVLYGKPTEIRTQAKTVGEMLKEKGIHMSVTDKLSVDQSTPISGGIRVELWRDGKQTLTVDEDTNFDVEQIRDVDREVGYHEVRTPGEKGKRTVTYEIEVKNGQEVSRVEIASVTTLEPKRQVEIIGAKYKGAYTTPGENEIITWGYLIGKGFTRNQTAGIMGNLRQEHGFNTTGDGLVQWTGSRKAALLARPDPYNIYTQLDFLMYELDTGYASVQAAIRASSTVDEAVIIFQNRFEKCGVCMQGNRIQYAYDILASH